LKVLEFSSSIQLIKILRLAPQTPSCVGINLDVSAHEWKRLTAWTTKETGAVAEAKSGSCFSVGCCSLRQFQEMDLSMPLDLGRLFSAYQQSHAWPSRGELQLINAGSDLDSESSIQLGPPALLTQDGLIDISHMLHAGLNKIQVQHRLKSGVYILFFLYHSPSPAQMDAFISERNREMEWEQWKQQIPVGFRFSMSFDSASSTAPC
jgi:hypothetical protein